MIFDAMNVFNNDDPKTNGEEFFYNSIKDKIDVIFDIGCRTDSEFVSFTGEVHYFDPVPEFIENLKRQTKLNRVAYCNNVGLGDEQKELYYYPRYQSFYNRITSCHIDDDRNKILLKIIKGITYIAENDIKGIDFMKIDTEGFELFVFKGFEDFLEKVKIIQFEYGGTFLDNRIPLLELITYLEAKGFHKFSYLTSKGTVPITNFDDHCQYCNIVCVHKNSNIVPY